MSAPHLVSAEPFLFSADDDVHSAEFDKTAELLARVKLKVRFQHAFRRERKSSKARLNSPTFCRAPSCRANEITQRDYALLDCVFVVRQTCKENRFGDTSPHVLIENTQDPGGIGICPISVFITFCCPASHGSWHAGSTTNVAHEIADDAGSRDHAAYTVVCDRHIN